MISDGSFSIITIGKRYVRNDVNDYIIVMRQLEHARKFSTRAELKKTLTKIKSLTKDSKKLIRVWEISIKEIQVE